ncbi:MAG TPA: SDR family oxidoreductase, partial [Caldimonas sp.]|nr:SDR family oxidoreductase [Caldimonas sp.]
MTLSDDLAGKVALVTGAGGTMGRAVAQMLLDAGCRVAMIDIRAEPMADLARAAGDAGLAVACDISDPMAVQTAHAHVVETLGDIDILINNAGILSNHKLEATGLEEWRRVLGANLDGALFWAQAVVPAMKGRRWGRIINTSSLAAKTGG